MTRREPARHRLHAGIFRVAIAALALLAAPAFAAPGADGALIDGGKKLVSEAKCEACHISKLGGDGSGMYSRKDRRVTSKSKLLAQVARCNSELSLGLFPEDETAIAAYLNSAHYKFKD